MKFETRKTHHGPQDNIRNRPHALWSMSYDRRGFSLIEIAIVIAIIGIISIVAISNLFSRRSRVDLDNSTRQIVTLLRDAQSRSINQEDNVVWGVHFDNTTTTSGFYSLFKTSYSATNTVARYNLPNLVQFATSSIASGGTLDITFTNISGVPSTSTSITVQLVVNIGAGGVTEVATSTTITISSTGLISF